MKTKFLSITVVMVITALSINSANAWYAVSKSGFGLFGYSSVTEKHWSYPVAGVKVCAAELTCSGGGFNSCKWTTPLSDCEKGGKVVVHQNPPADKEFQNYPENAELFQVCQLVDQKIQGGSNRGTIIYMNEKLVKYKINDLGTIYIEVYTQSEAISLGIWPL